MVPQQPKCLTVEEVIDNIPITSQNTNNNEIDNEDCLYMDVSMDTYTWEAGYDKTWEKLKEKDGLLDWSCLLNITSKTQMDRIESSESSVKNATIKRKATLRNLIILLDASESMQETDYKPNRFYYCISAIEEALTQFFRSNPLCRVGLVTMLHRQAMPVAMLSSSLPELVQILRNLRERDISGGALSFLNGFKKCCTMLTASPPYATREILLVLSSINTCDSGDIHQVLNEMVSQGIRVFVVSLVPELYVLRKATNLTGGSYSIVRNPEELKESLNVIRHATDWGKYTETRLVPMGFPKQIQHTVATLCMCHNRLSLKGYVCPCCHSHVCTLPTKCCVCDLHLASFLDIARTMQQYTSLFPQAQLKQGNYQCFMCEGEYTFGCVKCLGCHKYFCSQCHFWRASLLQQCPGCIVEKEIVTRHLQS